MPAKTRTPCTQTMLRQQLSKQGTITTLGVCANIAVMPRHLESTCVVRIGHPCRILVTRFQIVSSLPDSAGHWVSAEGRCHLTHPKHQDPELVRSSTIWSRTNRAVHTLISLTGAAHECNTPRTRPGTLQVALMLHCPDMTLPLWSK